MKSWPVLVLAAVLVWGCVPSRPTQSGKLKITATTTHLADLARTLGGDDAEVTGLMGPGVDPHLYKPTAGDLNRLTEADLVLVQGLDLEGRMEEVIEKVSDRGVKTLTVGESIPKEQLRFPKDAAGRPDPHIWFDVDLWQICASAVAKSIIESRPELQKSVTDRLKKLEVELDELKAEIRAGIAAIPAGQRVLVTAHDAFGYYGRAFGLEIMAVQGISTASEASLNQMSRLADVMAKRRIKAVFVESSVPSRTVEALIEAARAKGGQVQKGGELFSDALGGPNSGADSYVSMQRANLETIVKALK